MSYYQDGIELPTGEQVIHFLSVKDNEVFILLQATIKKLAEYVNDSINYGSLCSIEIEIEDIKKYIDHLNKIQRNYCVKNHKD